MNIINDVLVDKLFPDKPKRTKEIPLLEEKSVSGESIIIRDAYPDMPFKGLHVYGKSTQVTTTGAQLFDVDAGGTGWLNQETGEFQKSQDNYVSDFIPVETGVNFSTNVVLSPYVYSYDKDKNFISKEGYGNSFTPQGNIAFIRFCISSQSEAARKKAETIMINKGRAVPYEPYTGGKPSPSIEYPQEIVSVGDKGSINVDVDNNGYIQKGTYFDNIRPLPLVKGSTYHIECKKITSNDINCFVFNESDKSFGTSANLYDYGYSSKQLKVTNDTGVVDKECRMPMKYDGNGYTFKVTVDGLYLYQGVNVPEKNTDDFYIGNHANIVDEEYKKQTLTLKTPNGLLGIPVSTGGNYTDSNGQQWVCDEIDSARDKYVQWIDEYEVTGNEKYRDFGNNSFVNMYSLDLPENAYQDISTNNNVKAVLSNCYKQTMATRLRLNDIARGQQINATFGISPEITLEEFQNTLKNKYIEGNPVKIYYQLSVPIERDLTPEEIQAYKELHTNYPTTVIMNDENAGMKVTYLTPSFIPTRESALRMWFKENPII